MKSKLDPKEIGLRITELRKRKGWSQEEIAKAIHMSRPSYAQIELGKRGLDVLELNALAKALGFSLDAFMSPNFWDEEVLNDKEEMPSKKNEERIAVPTLQLKKFKNVLLYILERCAGKPNVGETVLYKLLYFSDFNYYEIYEEHLTGAKYRKLPYGPVPQKLDIIIEQMMGKKQLQKIKTTYHDYVQTRYLPLTKADLTQLKASEVEVIDAVIAQMGDWTATAISDYSHKDMPWLASKEGADINYELAFYREAPFSVRNYNEEIDA
jgi:transcriptional regulator with XRE-family HTH domain